MITIGILNQKGGVGKTTTAINLGVALAATGKRVLLVDLDPQATMTKGLGIELEDLTAGTYQLLNDNRQVNIYELSETLFVIPTSIRLAALSKRLFDGVNPSGILKRNLAVLTDQYDIAILDTPPNLDRLTINALVASSHVLIPCQCQKYATDGLEDLTNTISEVRELNEKISILGVIPTMYTANRKVEQEALVSLQNTFGELCRPPVPNRVEYVKAAAEMRPVETELADYWKDLAAYTIEKTGI